MVGDPQSIPDNDTGKDERLLDQEQIEEMTPAPDNLYLPISDCLTDLFYEDGSKAPDAGFHYSIHFEMDNLHDYNELVNHPQVDEIVNTITSYMLEHGHAVLELELLRDQNEAGAYAADEVGPNTLTPNTIADMEIILKDLVADINATYGVHIAGAGVNTSAQEVDGCGPSSWAVPNDQTELITPDDSTENNAAMSMTLGR